VETELIMAFSDNRVGIANSKRAVRLSRKNALDYAAFQNQENGNVTAEKIRIAGDFLEKEIVFGIFADNGELASVGQIHARATHNWIISGVETLPNYRRRGYSREIVSELTDLALSHAKIVTLFVDSENKAAISLCQNLGYKIIETGVRLIYNF